MNVLRSIRHKSKMIAIILHQIWSDHWIVCPLEAAIKSITCPLKMLLINWLITLMTSAVLKKIIRIWLLVSMKVWQCDTLVVFNEVLFVNPLRWFDSGGAKVWECTETVADYLTRVDETTKCLAAEFQDANVLDLGCGAGILGILALQCGGSSVHFQDYVSFTCRWQSNNVFPF